MKPKRIIIHQQYISSNTTAELLLSYIIHTVSDVPCDEQWRKWIQWGWKPPKVISQ